MPASTASTAKVTPTEMWRGLLPWIIVCAVLLVWRTGWFKATVNPIFTVSYTVDGLHNLINKVPPVVAKPTAEGAVPPEPEGSRLAAAIVVGVVVLLFAAGGWYYFRASSPAEKALAELRALPLVGNIMADNPAAEARMKAAIQERNSPAPHRVARPGHAR